MGDLTANGIYKPDWAAQEEGWGAAVDNNWDIVDRHLSSTDHWRRNGIPELWVSALAGTDPIDGGFDGDYAGRPDIPYRTIGAALASLPAGGGIIRLRGGSPVSAGAAPATPGAEYHQFEEPLVLTEQFGITSRKFVAIIGPGAGADPTVGLESGSVTIGASGAFPASRGLFEALAGTIEGFHLEGVQLVNPTGHGADLVGVSRGLTFRRIGASRLGGSALRIGGDSRGITVSEVDLAGCTGYGVELYADTAYRSPTHAEVKGGRIRSCAAGNIGLLSSRGSGQRYIEAVRIIGVEMTADVDENASGSGRCILMAGGGSVLIESCPMFLDTSANLAAIELTQAAGGSDETDYPYMVVVRNNVFDGGPDDVGGWSGDPTYRGVHVHAKYGRAIRVEDNEHLGGGQTTTFPMVNFGASTRGCVGNFRVPSAGGRGTWATSVNEIIRNTGSGNFGTWYDDALPGYRLWGTQPV